MSFLWIKNAASSAPTKKEETGLDLWATPECEMDRILSNREHFASHRIQNGTEMIKHWSKVTLPDGVASH